MVGSYEMETNLGNNISAKYYGKHKFQRHGNRVKKAKDLGFDAIRWLIDEIKRGRRNNEDRIILLTGEVRAGKSSLAAHLATRLGLEGYDRINYEPSNFLRTLHEVEKGGLAWLDEGGRGMYRKNAMTSENKLINQTFQQIGTKELVTIICLPHLKNIDSELLNLRIHYWGSVKFSGYDRGFVDWRMAGKMMGRQKDEKKVPRRPNEWEMKVYWEPLFRMRFPQFKAHNGFEWDVYEQKKEKKLNEFTSEALAKVDDQDKDGTKAFWKALRKINSETDTDVEELADEFDYSKSHIYKILREGEDDEQ